VIRKVISHLLERASLVSKHRNCCRGCVSFASCERVISGNFVSQIYTHWNSTTISSNIWTIARFKG